MDEDADLPLHDEAKARAKWRGDETILQKGVEDDGPAGETDNVAPGGGSGTSDAGASILKDLAERPPD